MLQNVDVGQPAIDLDSFTRQEQLDLLEQIWTVSANAPSAFLSRMLKLRSLIAAWMTWKTTSEKAGRLASRGTKFGSA